MVETKDKRLGYYALLMPALVVYLSVVIFPIGLSGVLSLTRWRNFVLQDFVGLDNYITILQDPEFHRAFWNNIQIMLTSVFGQIPLGIILAYVIFRKLVRGARFYEMIIFLPITISAVVVALLWNRIFSPVGLFTNIVRLVSGNQDYVVGIFQSETFAMVPILIVLLWMHTSLYMVMFLANMQRISTSVLEAAKIDGAGEFTILTKVVLPSLVNVVFISSIFAISGSFKSFDLVFAMTGGGPVNYTSVLSIYLYRHTFTFNNFGYGSAVSMIMVLISVGLITLARTLYSKFQEKYE